MKSIQWKFGFILSTSNWWTRRDGRFVEIVLFENFISSLFLSLKLEQFNWKFFFSTLKTFPSHFELASGGYLRYLPTTAAEEKWDESLKQKKVFFFSPKIIYRSSETSHVSSVVRILFVSYGWVTQQRLHININLFSNYLHSNGNLRTV